MLEKSSITQTIIKKLEYDAIFNGRVLSDSMIPIIFINSDLKIKKTRISSLLKNDIIAFWDNKTHRIIVHRIISINRKNKLIITKGDNLKNNDKPIKYSSVLGKVIKISDNPHSIFNKVKYFLKKYYHANIFVFTL
ncbi:hypothetical protein COU48_01315 [Candidatus Nomurabacteria bacterium CG10_big_fil_rev_8_21_14_0_10_03_31_7]|uniref:Signal peptidase I n=1 Tax=Candidatus Nomurabacteria bacterium CG10_big_fil_rev_8_21_14_0_10_03_31_7 TaxID=1974730 RepID=A0A2J0JI27_9BACT|nr:MAG: hypothetical protein COU48_01315 [Candidatus Nomurabacteria bacterium CG10_big_fil_rev_8_21_14_0_10_03_31_7]